MPVEIRELHITTIVSDTPPATGTAPAPAATTAKADTDAIIAACVEQVLQILNEKNER